MLTKERYLEFHSRFYDLLDEENVWFKKLVSFEQHKIASASAQGPSWMIFHMIADGHTSELLNGLNNFCTRSRRLEAWSRILNETENEDEKFEVLLEMVEPVFRITIDYPYALRSSLIYVSALVLRETARLLRFSFKDFKDRDITYKTIDRFRPLAHAQGWTGFDMFLQKLSQVSSKEFVEQTQNYRNRVHHQVEPNLEMGLLASVVRQKGEGVLSYEVGVENPVKLSRILPLLASHFDACVEAFEAFWVLLNEQIREWTRRCPNTQPSA
jgi:hypothetical protein